MLYYPFLLIGAATPAAHAQETTAGTTAKAQFKFGCKCVCNPLKLAIQVADIVVCRRHRILAGYHQ
jgi:hypothetical protein